MVDGKVEIRVKETLLYRVRNAVGTNMFRRLYADVDGKTKDILEDGDKSCAVFATTMLISLGLCTFVHATVEGAVRDMESFGWNPIRAPQPGCVVIWRVIDAPGKEHLHIGFYAGNGQAISNSSKEGNPQYHPLKAHRVHALYWHPMLEG